MDFALWLEKSALAQTMRSAPWPFPTVEIFHLTGMILVFGSIFLLNSRIYGLMLRGQPIGEIARGLASTLYVGLGIQVLSGPLLFVTSARRFYQSGPFRLKVALLLCALFYHFAVHRKLAFQPTTPLGKLRLSAMLSMVLWAGVILAGLGIELLNS
jgi:hypothetical protein